MTFPRSLGVVRWTVWLALGLVLAVALTVRLWSIHNVPGNAFYDAAVRSMGQSWHGFFFGALEPGGTVSIDKPPVDLWLQVAVTDILGYGLVGLHLPEALGGSAACALLFRALYEPFGIATALLGGLLLAVLPVAVLTSRSDTMDSLMAALQIAAIWLTWRALSRRQTRWSILAAVLTGIAFNVKLTEALLALPALLLLWGWAAPPRTRIRALFATSATFLVVSLSWALIASLTPVGQRPVPVGSKNGSIWRTIFLYNGLDRFSGHGAIGMASSGPSGEPGPLRLLNTTGSSYGTLIGVGVLASVLLGVLALAAQGLQRLRMQSLTAHGRLVIGLLIWFICGLIFFSVMRRLQVRYLEAFAPALCACLALALSALARDDRRTVNCALVAVIAAVGGYVLALDSALGLWTIIALASLAIAGSAAAWRSLSTSTGSQGRWVLTGSLVLGLLAAPVGGDLKVIADNRSDSILNDPTTRAMSRYLAAHNNGARFEVASANVYDIVGLVARDGLPVIMLNDVDGELEQVSSLQTQVSRGQVRFYFAAHGCHSGPHCPPNERWAYTHSVPVGHYPGLRRFGPVTNTASL